MHKILVSFLLVNLLVGLNAYSQVSDTSSIPILKDSTIKFIGDPYPEDVSDESGIVKLALTCKSSGEIINIKVIKSTISSETLQLYIEQLKKGKIAPKDPGKKFPDLFKVNVTYKVETK